MAGNSWEVEGVSCGLINQVVAGNTGMAGNSVYGNFPGMPLDHLRFCMDGGDE